jgi:3-methyladenine DNA glycosylase/8-oxoguanine DNA glycosylase
MASPSHATASAERRRCFGPSSGSKSASQPHDRCGPSWKRLSVPRQTSSCSSARPTSYIRSLAELVISGELDLEKLPADDEEAIALLTKIKGIGRWSAEIYLLFAEGRADVFPAGDLAVLVELGRLMGLKEKPTEKQLREFAEAWRPFRGAAAILAWHSYNSAVL